MTIAQYIIKYAIIAVFALSAFSSVSSIGKPRTPVTSGLATYGVAIDALLVVLMQVFWK